MALFVDTSAWFEAFDARAPLHEITADAIESSTGLSVTTTFVLAELVALDRRFAQEGFDVVP